MHGHFSFQDPALTVALALAIGTLLLGVARHLRIPGIVLLLAAGVLLGPDGIGIVHPQTLDGGLELLVGFAVAVILFEGGLNLRFRHLRHAARSIRRLVTVGALVTTVGGTLAVRLVLDWPWRLSLVFGTLVIVTGPTVITPLLRRIRVQRRVATVLEAEGVLGDAVGAVAATVALEIAVGAADPEEGIAGFALRMVAGGLMGVVVGLTISLLLRLEGWVPEGLRNIFTLTLVLASFQIANALVAEAGIVVVVAAGMVVGNLRVRDLDDLRQFKEQLTFMFIGMLFVLLAADVGLAAVLDLGWGGLAVVALLMFVVRPANVALSTLGTDLKANERAFVAWLAPRGIVAAAVSALFAETLAREGSGGGDELQALVFLVIAVTVVVQGLTGGWVASLVGVREKEASGYAILGANALGRALGHELGTAEAPSILIDSNPAASRAAEEEGLQVVYGSALQESVLVRSGIDHRAGCIGVTANSGINFTFARRARREFRAPRVWVALEKHEVDVKAAMVLRFGGEVLFGRARRLSSWIRSIDRGDTVRAVLRRTDDGSEPVRLTEVLEGLDDDLLALVLRRGDRRLPVGSSTRLTEDAEVVCRVRSAALERLTPTLAGRGLVLAAEEGD